MTDFIRTPDDNFANLEDFPYQPRYRQWKDLRQHYIDEGPRDGPAMMPERFERLVIMNTWLHHPEFEYSDGIRKWFGHWQEGGLFDRPCPDVALLLLLSGGLAPRDVIFPALIEGKDPGFTGKAAEMYRGFSAPYRGLPDSAFNGYRRFPLSIPAIDYDSGNGAAQTHTTGASWPGRSRCISSGAVRTMCSRRTGAVPGQGE